MADDLFSSDIAVLDLLRQRDEVSVTDLAESFGVTATAIRQRLTRLMAQGHIERTVHVEGRGRPSHRYKLTEQGRRKTGANFADLAIALWQEIREITDPEVRRGLLQRIAKRLVAHYGPMVSGDSLAERMESVASLFAGRRVPFQLDGTEDLPVLTALACPYPGLAEQDRGVCAMERMVLSDLLGEGVRLSRCRLDGESCCTFERSVPKVPSVANGTVANGTVASGVDASRTVAG